MFGASARDAPARPEPRRRSLSLFAQIVGLLAAGVMLAQLVNIVVILSSPQPTPVRPRVGTLADLLAGTMVPDTSSSLKLVRRPAPPPDGWEDPEERDYRTTLARLLGARPDEIRVVLRYAGPLPGVDRTNPTPPPAPRNINPFRQPGEWEKFSAARRLPDGSWRVVKRRDDQLLDPWQRRALLWFLGTAALVVLLGYVFARRVAAPLTRFAAAAERLGRDPNAPPLVLAGPAEITAAAQAFNDMQARLRRYVDGRTAMVGAIAHDLRTPLTRLRFRLEPAPEPLRAKVVADVAEMEAMVAATLDFVREARGSTVREPLEIGSLLETIADNMADTGEEVTVAVDGPVVIRGDPVALRSLFANLVENAVKYGGKTHASARVEGDEAVIRVEDEGPGLPDAELAQVFEPFYRVERSRSREKGGVGLGLALAQSITHLHGGEIALENRAGGGLRATVRLPL